MIDFNVKEISPLCENFGVELNDDIINKLNI